MRYMYVGFIFEIEIAKYLRFSNFEGNSFFFFLLLCFEKCWRKALISS